MSGFKLDDFPGNMTVILAKVDKETLVHSNLCPEDYSINNDQPDWLVISPTYQYDAQFFSTLAEKISAQHGCSCIKYDFGDGAGAHLYNLFDNGECIQAYSFHEDFSDEMGEFAKKAGPNETIVRNGEEEFYYFSEGEHPSESVLEGGLTFLDQLFVDQKAELSWEYLPS